MEVRGAEVPMMVTAERGSLIHSSKFVKKLPAMNEPTNTVSTCNHDSLLTHQDSEHLHAVLAPQITGNAA